MESILRLFIDVNQEFLVGGELKKELVKLKTKLKSP